MLTNNAGSLWHLSKPNSDNSIINALCHSRSACFNSYRASTHDVSHHETSAAALCTHPDATWYQGYGRDGYPAIYLNLGEGKPVLRTKPVDDGEVWTKVSAAVEHVRIRSKRHNVNIAALHEHSQRQEVTPEFLAHVAFNHCGDNVMKLMRKHPDLYNLNLGPVNRVVGHAKRCTGC